MMAKKTARDKPIRYDVPISYFPSSSESVARNRINPLWVNPSLIISKNVLAAKKMAY